MQGFPPPEHARVTLANWQEPPYNRWSFAHLREIVPTQRIPRGTADPAPLTPAPQPVGAVPVRRVTGAEADVNGVLAATYTDAVVIVHHGRLVFEVSRGPAPPEA